MHTNEIYMLLLIVYYGACLLFLINSPFLLFFDNSFPKWLSGDCQSTYCSSRCDNCLNMYLYLLLFEVYFKTSILNPQLLLQQFNHTFLLLFSCLNKLKILSILMKLGTSLSVLINTQGCAHCASSAKI